MIPIKSDEEIKIMEEGSRILASVVETIGQRIGPGVTGLQIDKLAEENIMKHGAKPAFKGYRGFPASVCFSVDDVVVHGIPNDEPLEGGQIVGIDIGAIYKGYYSDMAVTYEIGDAGKEASELMKATEQALYEGIDQCFEGRRIGDISNAVQRTVERKGFSVVRDLVGHGIGIKMHEEPQIPNYGKNKSGEIIRKGMTFAIEPMVNHGKPDVVVDSDDWTVRTKDNSLSAHFEHTVAVTDDGPLILTKI